MTVPDLHDIDKRVALVEQAVPKMEKELEKINGHLRNLVWLVIAGLLGGVVQWIAKGGLNVG